MAAQHHIQRDDIFLVPSFSWISPRRRCSGWSGKRSEDGGAREM